MIIDAHVHISPEFCGDDTVRFMDRTGTDRAVIQAVWHSGRGPLAPRALEMKKRSPGRFYVFAAPDASLYHRERENIGRAQLEYLRPLLDGGADGVKLLEGKPQMRKAHPVPDFNLECWEPFWDFMERNGVPVTFHVNDPETFWSPDPSPWLIRQGWHYDGSFINNEDQYAQVEDVLRRHPKLKLILAHAYFMSARLERLSDILDRYGNVMIDLTPGIEMYENFSADHAGASEFFLRYHDRICYGTDIGGRCILTNEGCAFNEKENLRRPRIVRGFLENTGSVRIESDGSFLVDRKPFEMRCLGLEGERLEEIYSRNLLGMLTLH